MFDREQKLTSISPVGNREIFIVDLCLLVYLTNINQETIIQTTMKQELTTRANGMKSDFEDIKYYIKQAEEYGLLEEVVTTAIKHAKENPDYEAEVILDMACDDWDI